MMYKQDFIKRCSFTLGVLGLVLSASAFAGKDDLYVSTINGVLVDGSNAGYATNLSGMSNNRILNISNPVEGGKVVSVDLTWGIAAGSDPRTTTYAKNAVEFSGSTEAGTNVGPIAISPSTCNFATSGSSCSANVSFTAPNVTDTIQLKIDPTNTGTGNSALQGRNLVINFSTIEQQVGALDSRVTVPDPQCFAYGAGDVDLSANLTELVSGDPISGGQLGFSVDSSPIGSDYTDGNGDVVLSYNINGLSAGDHNLFVGFAGDNQYNPGDSSATLGIFYNFVGFQPPINPAGNSIFGNGRVIPVKIKIVDANLYPVTDAEPQVWIYQWTTATGLGEVLEAASSVSAADTDNIMRYDPDAQQYIYNADLSELANGTYAIVVDLGDSDACSQGPYKAVITVAKKGKK